MKAYLNLDCSPKTFMSVLLKDHKYRAIYDNQFESGKVIEQIADQCWVYYIKFKKIAFVAQRDC